METTLVLFVPGDAVRALAAEALSQAGLSYVAVDDFEGLLKRLEQPCGAVLIAEEAMDAPHVHELLQRLAGQPLWSDLPILVLLDSGGGSGKDELFSSYENITFLERPVRPISLGSTVEAILRSRQQQYQMRTLLDEQEYLRAGISEAQQARKQFLAALSHELRTPLSPVLMTVAALREDPAVSEDMQQDLDVIQRNVELEARLIDDLLDLTQIISGKLALQTRLVDLHRLLERAVEDCQANTASARGQKIVLRQEAAQHCSRADAARLQQVFGHLLVNASKFSPPQSSIEVVTSNPRAGLVRIAVTDRGMGIEPELLPKLFDAFQQGHPSVARRCGGLGLGLAISKTLVELHGGALRVQSAGRDQGSTFALELDAAPGTVAANEERPAEAAVVCDTRADATVADQPRTEPELDILLVEDHEPTRRTLHRLLTRAGHHVTEAENVAGALEFAAQRHFDLLMSDLGLPDASGLELMRELGDRYQLPGIALSGYGMKEDIQASRDAGFREHFTKPVDWHRLKECVHSVAGRKEEADPEGTG